jgi:hypothetical protein
LSQSSQVVNPGVPTPSKPTTVQPSPSRSRVAGNCFMCGAPGHFAKNCTGRQRSSIAENTALASTSSFPVEQSPATLYANGAAQNGRQAGHLAPYLRGVTEVREFDCLLDTGSEISLLPTSIVPLERIASTAQTLTAANGTPIPVLALRHPGFLQFAGN